MGTRYQMPRVYVHRRVTTVAELRALLRELDAADAPGHVPLTLGNCQVFAEWEIASLPALTAAVEKTA